LISKIDKKGFTIIEVLVAGTITAIAAVGLVTILMKSRDIDTMDKHLRQARSLIMAQFESAKYGYLNFSKLGTTVSDSTITIDPRQGFALTGTLSGTIVSQVVNTIPTKQVILRVNWTEHNGETGKVELTKWLCQAQ
jgi:prepilin-type N-terminal cleavage/methylation domain-containing protein